MPRKVIIIDPGHGIGAEHVGGESIPTPPELSITEAELVLQQGLALRNVMQARGWYVEMTRENESAANLTLQNRRDWANKIRTNGTVTHVDVFISLHFNGSLSHQADRTEVWYPPISPSPYNGNEFEQTLANNLSSNVAFVTLLYFTKKYAGEGGRHLTVLESGNISNKRVLLETLFLDCGETTPDEHGNRFYEHARFRDDSDMNPQGALGNFKYRIAERIAETIDNY